MKQVFDLIEAINDRLTQFLDQEGLTPNAIAISPASYRRLLEIKSWEWRIGNLIIGCAPMREIETPLGKASIIIDEILSDTEVEVVPPCEMPSM